MAETYDLADLEPRPFGRTITFRFTHCLEHDAHAIDALGQMMAVVARNAWELGDRQTAVILSDAANTVILEGAEGLAAGLESLERGFALARTGDAPPDAESRLLRVVTRWLDLRARIGGRAASWGETTVVIARAADGSRRVTLDIAPLAGQPAHRDGAIGAEVAVSDTLPLWPVPAGGPTYRRVYRLDVNRHDPSHALRINAAALRLSALAGAAGDEGNAPLVRLIVGAAETAVAGGMDGALASWSTIHLAIADDPAHEDRPVLEQGEEALLEIAARWVAIVGGAGPRRIERAAAVLSVRDHSHDRREIAVETLLPASAVADATPDPAVR